MNITEGEDAEKTLEYVVADAYQKLASQQIQLEAEIEKSVIDQMWDWYVES